MGSYQQIGKSSFQPAKVSPNPSLQRKHHQLPLQQQGGQTLEEMRISRANAERIGDHLSIFSKLTPPQPVQTKLAIGEVGDKYEQEADAVAAEVVKKINAPSAPETPNEGNNNIQGKGVIQPKLQLNGGEQGGEASSEIEGKINSAKGSGQSLAPDLQAKMGEAMGADFSGVKVHTNTEADQLNRSLQAKAFATGQDVFFRQGAYAPQSEEGQELIAHELTHVVQQGGAGLQKKSQEVSRKEVATPKSEVLTHLQSLRGKGNHDTSIYRKEIKQLQARFEADKAEQRGERTTVQAQESEELSEGETHSGEKNSGDNQPYITLLGAIAYLVVPEGVEINQQEYAEQYNINVSNYNDDTFNTQNLLVISLSEFEKLETIYNDLQSGEQSIKIIEQDGFGNPASGFNGAVLEALSILIARPTSLKLIEELLYGSKIVVIRPSAPQLRRDVVYPSDPENALLQDNGQPNSGSDSIVFLSAPFDDSRFRASDADGNTITLPVYTNIAHELIHAHRNAQGIATRHIKQTSEDKINRGFTDLEEEQTIGQPTDRGVFTENAIRREFNLPARWSYTGCDATRSQCPEIGTPFQVNSQ